MATVQRFEELAIWKDAVSVGVEIYDLTSRGKLGKDFSSKDQLRRAAISISNNIAEGFEYNNNKVFIRFLHYAKGSAGELRSNLTVLKEARVINTDEGERLRNKVTTVSQNISGFIKYLKTFESNKKK
jgi:four helix bundle protein